eukprot:3740034-Rhodomonas_salina.1
MSVTAFPNPPAKTDPRRSHTKLFPTDSAWKRAWIWPSAKILNSSCLLVRAFIIPPCCCVISAPSGILLTDSRYFRVLVAMEIGLAVRYRMR